MANEVKSAATEAVKPTQNVTYIDQDGQKQTGVASVPAGDEATAKANAQISYFDTMKGYYAQALDDAIAANNEAAQKAAAQALDNTNQQIDALRRQYEGTNRQLYRDYMDEQRKLPQQMAAQGYSGGMSESSRLRLANSYEEALAENERARASGEAGLNAAYTQAAYQAQAQADSANAAARQQNVSYMAALEEARYQDKANRAATLAAAGDFTGYLDIGYSQEDVDYMTRLWLAENPDAKEAWIAAHPEDAARLGIESDTVSGYSYSTQTEQLEEKKPVGQLYNDANAAVQAQPQEPTTYREAVALAEKAADEGDILGARARYRQAMDMPDAPKENVYGR